MLYKECIYRERLYDANELYIGYSRSNLTSARPSTDLHSMSSTKVFVTSKRWKQRTVNDVTQFCACCGRARTLTTKPVGQGRHCCCLATGLRPRGACNGSQVFTASTLNVRRLISLTVALAAG